MRTILTLALVLFSWNRSQATVDEAMEAVLVRMAPLHAHFDTAKQAVMKDDLTGAVAALFKAEALVRKQANAAVKPHGDPLSEAADQLKMLSDDVGAGEAAVDDMDVIFANIHATLADFYLGKSQRAADSNEPSLAGAFLIASANHAENSAKWGGRKLQEGGRTSLEFLRRIGRNLINGVDTGADKLEDVFKRGAATMTDVLCPSNEITTGVVVGQDHVFQLTVPDGWHMDTESGMEHGLVVLFYPKRNTWETAKVFAYAATVARAAAIQSIPDAVQSFIDDYNENGHTNYRAKKDEAVKLADGREAIVYRFEGDAFGNHEVCAFIRENKTINFVVMTSQDSKAFENAMPKFRQLVSSYAFVSDDPTQEEAYITKLKGENWRERLPTEAKVPLREKKKVRRHK